MQEPISALRGENPATSRSDDEDWGRLINALGRQMRERMQPKK